jgi:hypothetical protein
MRNGWDSAGSEGEIWGVGEGGDVQIWAYAVTSDTVFLAEKVQ